MSMREVPRGGYLAKSSMEMVPIMGASKCVWGSMPPGMTYLPSAFITRVLASPCMHSTTLSSDDGRFYSQFTRQRSTSYLQGGADRCYETVLDEQITNLGCLGIDHCPSLQSCTRTLGRSGMDMYQPVVARLTQYHEGVNKELALISILSAWLPAHQEAAEDQQMGYT